MSKIDIVSTTEARVPPDYDQHKPLAEALAPGVPSSLGLNSVNFDDQYKEKVDQLVTLCQQIENDHSSLRLFFERHTIPHDQELLLVHLWHRFGQEGIIDQIPRTNHPLGDRLDELIATLTDCLDPPQDRLQVQIATYQGQCEDNGVTYNMLAGYYALFSSESFCVDLEKCIGEEQQKIFMKNLSASHALFSVIRSDWTGNGLTDTTYYPIQEAYHVFYIDLCKRLSYNPNDAVTAIDECYKTFFEALQKGCSNHGAVKLVTIKQQLTNS